MYVYMFIHVYKRMYSYIYIWYFITLLVDYHIIAYLLHVYV